MNLLSQVIGLYYDRNYLDAYELTKELWTQPDIPEGLTTEELIWGSRLAEQLGSRILAHRLLTKARSIDETNPLVQLYSLNSVSQARGLHGLLRHYEQQPRLESSEPRHSLYWIIGHALTRASLRDFTYASELLKEAEQWDCDKPWVDYAWAELAFRRDDWDTAQALSDQVFSVQPKMYHNLHLRGRIAVRNNTLPSFLEEMKQTVSDSQCIDLTMLYIHHLSVQAERWDRAASEPLLSKAWKTCATLNNLVPLADKRMHHQLAAVRLDVASLMRDEEAMLEQAQKLNTEYHIQLAKNLRSNPGKKIWICSHVPLWQAHNTCLPSSVGTLFPEVDTAQLAQDLTYGGTDITDCLNWLQSKTPLTGVPFIADPKSATRLLQNGIGFIYLTGGDNWSHAMAAIGFDEVTEELIIHDPSSERAIRLPLAELKRNVGAFGPQCVALVEEDRLEFVKELIPESQREPYAAFLTFQNEVFHLGKNDGTEIFRKLQQKYPVHPLSKRVEARFHMRKNRIDDAVAILENLLLAYPENLYLRMDLLEAFYRCQNSARQLEVYRELLAHARIRDIPASAKTRNPVFIARYADYLGINDKDIPRAQTLLELGLRQFPFAAELWHVLADICWRRGDFKSALLPMRIAACLEAEDGHYARGVLDLYALLHQLESGLSFLEQRAQAAGSADGSGGSWVTWIEALTEHGLPERAEGVLNIALQKLPNDSRLMTFAMQFYTRQGTFNKAEQFLPILRKLENQRMAVLAEAEYHEARGNWREALSRIENLHSQDPGSDSLARQYLYLLRGRDGAEAALEKARNYEKEFPDHEGYEVLLYDYLQSFGLEDERVTRIRQRLSRNPKEIQGWIELGNSLLNQAEEADGTQRTLLLEEVQALCSTVEELALSDQRVRLLKARFCQCSGLTAEAEALCLEAISLDVNNAGPIYTLLTFYKHQPVQPRTDKLLSLANFLIAKGSNAEAMEDLVIQLAETQGTPKTFALLQQWKTTRPQEKTLEIAEVRLLTECAQDRTDFEKAASLLDQIVDRFPGIARFQYMRIEVRTRLNEAAVEKDLEHYISRYPLHIDARNKLAQLKLSNNQPEAALALLKQGVDFLPQDRESWQTLALFMDEALQDQEGAAEILSSSLALMPHDFGLVEHYYHLLCEIGKFKEALLHAKSMTERFADRAYVWHMLATVMGSAGGSIPLTEIEQAYKKALSLKPGLFKSADGLAYLLAQNGRTQEARTTLNALPNKGQHDHEIKGRLAWIQYVEGNSIGAISSMHRVLEMHPDYQWGWMQLLSWLEESGSQELVRKHLKQIPETLMHHIDWRVRRIQVLENCGEGDESLNEEWSKLIQDFPSDSQVMLTYVDRCIEKNEIAAARQTLECYAISNPNAPYVQARFVQLLVRENNRSQAVELAFKIWSRPGTEGEWPDYAAWTALVPQNERILAAGLADRFRQILHSGDPIRPLILERACSLQSKLNSGQLFRLAKKHPARMPMINAVLSGMQEQQNNKEALRFWESLSSADKSSHEMRQCGLRLLFDTGPDKRSMTEIKRIMNGWTSFPDVEMWTVGIYIFVLELELDMMADRKKGLTEHDLIRFAAVEENCKNCMAGLQLDTGMQYILTAWCKSLLAQGKIEAFHEVYKQYGHILKDRDQDYWRPPLNETFLTSLPRLRTLLQNKPIYLETVCVFGLDESKQEFYPVGMFRGLVEALRERQFVNDRDAVFRPCAPSGRATAQPSSKSGSPWWLFFLLFLLIRGCASMLDM